MLRVLLGGVVGGIVLFTWGVVAHLFLPLGEMGVRDLPEDVAMINLFRPFIEKPGVYRFPAIDAEGADPTPEEVATWTTRHEKGPTGFLVYQPAGSEPMSAQKLLVELGSNLLVALIAAMIAGRLSGRYGPKVLTVMLLGVLAWVEIDLSYWTWFGFTGEFVTASLIVQVVGWLLAGLVIVAIVKPVHSMKWTQKIPGA